MHRYGRNAIEYLLKRSVPTSLYRCTLPFVYIIDLRTAPWIDQYVAAVYFTMTTFATVGYGDITANTTAERVFVVGLMIVGLVFFSVFVSSLVNALTNDGGPSSRYRVARQVLRIYRSRMHTPLAAI